MKIELPAWVKKFFVLHPAAILFGAWAVNMYAPQDYRRMTGDVDLMTLYPQEIAETVAALTGGKAVEAMGGWCVMLEGIKIADIMAPRDGVMPAAHEIDGVVVVTKAALIALKMDAAENRRGTLKGEQDRLDIQVLRGDLE